MKKKKPCGSLKWMATIKINNKTIDNTLILACSWWNNSVVYFILTLYQSDETIIIQCQSEASKIDVQALIMVEQYCKFIKSVDITDQLCALYMIHQKTKK
jgi:hypothetical protein